jgi:hypothetical protein
MPIVTRAGKGSPLTNTEVDDNFLYLKDNKLELIVSGTTSAASITPAANDFQYNVTALAVDTTINAPSGTPTAGFKQILRIKDNGVARTISWNSIFRAVGVTLPTTTVINKTLYVGYMWNSTDSKWDVMAVSQEV